MLDLKEIAALIDTGSYTKEVCRIARAVRLTVGLRRKLTASVISSFLDFALVPGSEAHTRLSSFLPKSDEHDMEVDTASSNSQAPPKHLPAELEIYCYFIVLLFLIDQKKYSEAKACSSASIARLKSVNRRTVDVIASKFTLLALHHSATLRHDELGQFCRYLFYLVKIRTIQLEYTDAKESLLQAARKAHVASLGFRIQCNKWAIIVRQASPKASSPKSISCSVANSSSNGKKTCMLLDCENSGEIVAEGIVMSANPEDTVHCKPLGPNASKVWVKIIKIGTVKVWRPSPEVECVVDALGTTVAWPTDKIVVS